ncbi:cyclase [Micromonospora sp. NEAU-HG-1]|nr:cyclase [Micromonospora rubida]
MTTTVEKSVEVNVPIRTAYNQWTQFEEFPMFMGAVREVHQLDDRRMHWVAEIAGVQREWDAKVLEQVPDRKVAWAATEGTTNAGAVYFQPVDTNRTMVRLFLEYEPEGFVEKTGERLHLVERQAESDLERFKTYIESRGVETGGWRGTIDEGRQLGTPGIEYAAGTRSDSGRGDGSARDTDAGTTAPTTTPYPTGAGATAPTIPAYPTDADPDGARRPL